MTPELKKAELSLARASCVNPAITLRANGAEISAEKRDEMLRACAAGEYVELELDVMAFEQKPGATNRNFVRFRDGLMMAFGRTGVGTPFLRDHEQDDALARGGTILDSRTEKRGDGDYAIFQRVKLTAPWAVELALRGLLSTVSIGWNPTGTVQCSVCGMNFFRCSHMPGQSYEKEDGSKEMAICERVYTSAELVETSAVSVPAVPSAQIDAIRAALGASNGGKEPRKVTMDPKVLALLGLAATAGENEVEKAVEVLKREAAADKAELAIVKAELSLVRVELGEFKLAKKKTDEDAFIRDALASGRMAIAEEKQWRAIHELDAARATALLAERPAGSVTPVGLARQSGSPAPAEPQIDSADAAILAAGGDPAKLRADLARDGLSREAIDKQLAAMLVPSRKGA